MRAPSGRLIYAAPERETPTGSGDRRSMRACDGSRRRAAGLSSSRPSGYASALAQAIDEGGIPIAGTLAGDNTIFIAAKDNGRGAAAELLLPRRRVTP